MLIMIALPVDKQTEYTITLSRFACVYIGRETLSHGKPVAEIKIGRERHCLTAAAAVST